MYPDSVLDEHSDSSYEDFLYSYDDDGDLFDDYYEDLSSSVDNYDQQTSDEQTITELYLNCIHPTLRDAFRQFLWPILLANFLSIFLVYLTDYIWRQGFKKTSSVSFSRLMIMVSGYLLILNHYLGPSDELSSSNYHQLIFLTTVIFVSSVTMSSLLCFLPLMNENFAWILWIVHIVAISLNECFVFLFGWNEWIKLRPNIMLILMKSISYYHETKLSQTKKEVNTMKIRVFLEIFFDYLSYLLHPCTIILGVWHPHSVHSKVFIQHQDKTNGNNQWKKLLENIYHSIGSLLSCLLFLICSTCLIEYFLDHIVFEYFDSMLQFFSGRWYQMAIKFFRAYSIAIQFHYSHYFICFLGQSMFDLWNFRLTVTKPLEIEWPRSLVDVVVAWNIPMHQWLKRYVFQMLKTNLKYNIYMSILATYFISSYLHGFNFQIWSVLLTLGLLTQAEFKLRKSLAKLLSSCIESRNCHYDYYEQMEDSDDYTLVCRSGHQRTKEKWWPVRFINLMFTLLALSNLAFLGATFDGQPDSSSLMNVWTVWGNLYFYSYITMAIMFTLYKLCSWTL